MGQTTRKEEGGRTRVKRNHVARVEGWGAVVPRMGALALAFFLP